LVQSITAKDQSRQNDQRQITAAIATRDVVKSADLVAVAYDPALQQYACEAHLRLDEVSVKRLALANGYLTVLSDPLWVARMHSAIEKDNPRFIYTLAVDATHHAERYARCVKRPISLTVGPDPNGVARFVVNIEQRRCAP
jgi:hypothetical protein